MKSNIKVRLSLKNRMLFLILSTTIVIFIAAVGYIGLSSRKMSYEQAKNNADNISRQSALKIENKLNVSMDAIRTLAEAFSSWKMWPDTAWQEYVVNMYEPVYENSPQIYKLWDSWELNKVEDGYNLPYGRYTHTFYRIDGQVRYSVKKRSMDGDPALYAKIKKEASESIWEPYFDVFSEQGQETSKFMTSMSVPIKDELNEYVGIVAVDITMDELQKIVKGINPMHDSYAFLISNGGVFISHPDSSAIGKSISDVMPGYEEKYNLYEKVSKGRQISFENQDNYSNTKSYISMAPITVGKTNTPWSVGLSIPVKVITEEANYNLMISIFVAVIGLLLLSIIIYLIAVRIARPISHSTTMLKRIEQGDIHNLDKMQVDRQDEIGEMARSLNKVVDGLNETAGFAEEIGKGNLESDFNPKSNNDVLGNALIEMRRSLQQAREEEKKRKEEDEKQRWETNGLAKFGDILRKNNDALDELSFNVISNLVDYLGANQGALFVINDKDENDQFFELQAAIAYDRRRYLKKEIRVGEDLVGRCAHEKATIYMTDLPDDYVDITSGLGKATPNSILIVPAVMNDVVFGVIEMASFNKMEKYQIEFVEKIGETIASTLNSVKVNQRTQELLRESQNQREELSSQEEEMRQNLEELQATQEEASRRQFEMRGLINALSSSTYTIEYDLYGAITDVNETFAELVGLTKEQMIGMNHRDGIDFSEKSKEDYERFWEDLRHGIPRTDVNHIQYNNRDIYLQETYTPILDEEDNVYKILKIGFDITKQIEIEHHLEVAKNQIDELMVKSDEDDAKLEELKENLNEEKAKNLKVITQLKELQEKMQNKNVKPGKSGKKENEPKASGNKALPKDKLVEFNTKMKTGIEEMDEQHSRIIDMANDIYKAFEIKENQKQIKEMLKTFVDYTAWHFSNEERYFDEFDFEYQESHKKAHNTFTSKVQDFVKKYDRGRVQAHQEIMAFIKEWLETHFTTEDQQYVELFQSKGL